MKFKLFSSILNGKTLTLSATQAGRTAGPVTQANYGIATMSTGGVAITVDRTRVKCAPDSVRFGVDLSAAGFDTPGPGNGEVYDPRLHDLIFLWNTGDTGSWSAPEKVLPEWNDKSRAKGPWFAHCYTKPGTYTVSLTVIEPSSGKIATDSVTIDVTDPDKAYSGQKTICINPPGVTASDWGPLDALYFEWDPAHELINDQPWWASINFPSDRRFLFNSAESYPDKIAFLFDGTVDINNPFIGTAGSGRAVLVPGTASSDQKHMIFVGSGYDGSVQNPTMDFRIDRIDARGTFDPTLYVKDDVAVAGLPGSLIRTNKYLDLTISDCRTKGFLNSTVQVYFDQGNGSNATYPGHLHVDDTLMTDFGGQYPGIYGSRHDRLPDSSMTVSGTALVQNPNAISGGQQTKAPLRENSVHKFNLRCSECFGQDDDNAGWKICTTPQEEIGHIINVDGASAEGNFMPFYVQQNVSQGVSRTIAVNAIFDGVIAVADYSSDRLVESHATGVTIRNMLGIVPNSPKFANESVTSIPGWNMNDEENGTNSIRFNSLQGQKVAPGFVGEDRRRLYENQTAGDLTVPNSPTEDKLIAAGFTWIGPNVQYTTRTLENAVGFILYGSPPAETLAAPCEVYSCTFIADRPVENNKNGYSSPTVSFDPAFKNKLSENNILDGPWQEHSGDEAPYAPLSSDTLWTPRCSGFIGYQTKTVVRDFATPVDAVVRAAPLAGSPALGAALSGKTAYVDITGKVRPVYPSIGAWEMQ